MVLMEFFRHNEKISEHIVDMTIDTSLAISIHLAFSEYRDYKPKRISNVEFNNLLFKDNILVITNNSNMTRKTQYWLLEKDG